MLLVPREFASSLTTFAPLFTTRAWQHVQVLLVGAILAPGKRTITAALRVMGLAQVNSFQQDHRVLNRAVWSGRKGSRLLLQLLVHTLAPTGPLVMGLDDTPLSAVVAQGSWPKGFTAIPCAHLTALWSRPADCAG
jgi:hypothetical protein